MKTSTRRPPSPDSPPPFCECSDPDPCRCGFCSSVCNTCGRMVYRAVLEDVYAEGVEHEGPYRWGDAGYGIDRPTVAAHP